MCVHCGGQWGNLSLPSLKGRGYMLPFIVLIAVLLLMRLIPFVEDAVTGKWGDGKRHCAQPFITSSFTPSITTSSLATRR